MPSQSKSVIFDMDGTLIDSQESILLSFKMALDYHQINNVIPLSREVVGPPLRDTLQRISGVTDNETILKLERSFIEAYDEGAYRKCKAYNGIGELLKFLGEGGYRVFIATNKRQIPTMKIVNHFKWESYFEKIYSIDSSPTGRFSSKIETLRNLILDCEIEPKNAIYVGDRPEDFDAAKLNNIKTLLVNWGYGTEAELNDCGAKLVKSVNELHDFILVGLQ